VVPKLGHLKADIEVEGEGRIIRRDTDPVVLAGLLGLGNDAKAFDDVRRDPLVV